ncbi:FAS1-like dehydratase domain-containing protein [Rhodococcus sp. LB1]|uniref:FAS1-like dehydratase domain-containing protein n=1 Tax=Rhodococcus sp. LB1 TaxID=1807499 RepID=UPI00077A4768|nr:MaoC family dehydratase N-terminal domain-containing protein [Rhodococcus sp. LB1]KXX58923.1 hypothetical protein AZG88_43460 [Rhodococcus sp. LB1]
MTAVIASKNPDITDEMVEKAQALVGVWLRRDVHVPTYAESISPIDIRRWAEYSMGDDNPLYSDPEYAAHSFWGGQIAPPTLLYTFDSTIVAPGFRGIQWIYGGTRWQNYVPIRVGDKITARARVIGMEEKVGKHANRFFVQIGQTVFENQRGELVSIAESDVLRIPRSNSGKNSGLRGFEDRNDPPTYTDEQLDAIRTAYLTEARRGAEPRYWEDVEPGDVLRPVVKGPLTLVDIMAFYSGRRNTYPPLKLAVLDRERHPGNVYHSPTTRIPMHPAAGHMDNEIAREIGMPRAYDQGWQRANWGCHLITNWAGDMSFIESLNHKLLAPNLVGDTTWMKGTVSGKRVAGDQHLVDIEFQGINQDDRVNVIGTATVRLPSKDVRDLFLLSDGSKL